MRIRKRRTVRASYGKLEKPESKFIPYEGHWDSNTILTKNNELLMVIKLDGYSFETADDEDVDMKKSVRNTLFKSLAKGNIALWFHTVRRKRRVNTDGEFTDMFCRYVDEQWQEKHSDTESYVNELYISVLIKKDKSGSAAIDNFIRSAKKRSEKDGWLADLKALQKDLHEITYRLLGSLKEYRARLLGLYETNDGVYSEVLEFLGFLSNCGYYNPVLVPSANADQYLPTHRLYFGRRTMEARSPSGESRFAGCLSVKEYASYTSAGMMDAFLQLPFEFVISQSYVFSNRESAISKMSLHQKRMLSAGDKGVSQALELSEAMDLARGGHIAFGKHHFTIFAFESDLKKLEIAMSLCYAELVNSGIIPSRETMAMQACYWAQLPGNLEYIARGSVINTMNLASFASLHNYPVGRGQKNHWGPPVTVLDTTSGTPYYFNFHVRDVGHTTIIGPTGAGKTVLMNFLMAQAQKFNGRMFFFDKDRGAEIFIRAIGGIYSVIEPGKVTHFNPLQLEESHENKAFLADWIKALALASISTEITPEEIDRIAEAVEGNYKMSKDKRRLSEIAPFLGLEGPGTLAGRMKMWHGKELRAQMFDNPTDELDFRRGNVFGFEMGEVLQDGVSLGPVLLYLFHKIQQSLDGTPTMIVLDEAWALIDNDVFGPRIKDWLKTLRKLNAMVVFATQSVEDASKSDISDTLIQQTATQIFLPNPKATAEYQDKFMLTNREFAIIKTTNPGSRYFLVKQGSEVVVARIDLSGLEDIINVLSGRAETVLLLDEIREEVGDNPRDWLPVFLKRVGADEDEDIL